MGADYLPGVVAVRRRHPARPWPIGRTLAFGCGLGVIAVATQSGIGTHDEVFAVHMVQHLLLIMVAPPLLVYGRPVTLLMHAARNPVHTWVKRVVRSRVVTALTWPPFTLCWYCAVVAVTHLPPLRDLVLENAALHDGEHWADGPRIHKHGEDGRGIGGTAPEREAGQHAGQRGVERAAHSRLSAVNPAPAGQVAIQRGMPS